MPLIPPVMVLNSTTVKPSVLVRVGVSFISEAQACSNAETEIPDFDFAGVRKVAFDTWNELLGRIQVRARDQPGGEELTDPIDRPPTRARCYVKSS